jgi:uncharacterized protein with HEPN domain
MKHPERIEDYLEHIALAIERITEYVRGFDGPEALQRSQQAQDAVIRNIEIIGEAANRILKQAPEFMTSHSQLPWASMRGMRNRMIHNYFEVNLSVVWNTIREDLPKLKAQINSLLMELKQDPDHSRE